MIRVQSVAPDSLGAELGLTPGTELLAVNGRALEDFLDWEFLTADDRFVLAARMATGEEVEYDVERPEGLAMGVTLADLYGLGAAVLSVSVVPVALTEFSKRELVREPTVTECREALATVDRLATRALAERGGPWCYGADDLYLQAGEPLPEAGWYGDFEQRENGVGGVRFLQTRIAAALDRLPDLSGQRIGVVTGTAMGPLMPQVVAEAATATGGRYDLVVVENTLFGQSVTTAGLLPAAAIERALAGRTDLDFVLLPGESVNDDLGLMEDVGADELAARVPMPVHLSHDFADVLGELGTRNAERGTGAPASRSAFPLPRSAFGVGQG